MSAALAMSGSTLSLSSASATRSVRRSHPQETAQNIAYGTRVRAGVSASDWEQTAHRLRAIASLQNNWDTYQGVAPNTATLAYAASELSSLRAMQHPAPDISLAGDGQLLATWSVGGIEIELWFEAPNAETVLIDDKRGKIDFAGPDPFLFQTAIALREVMIRA